MKNKKTPKEAAADCIRAYHGAGEETDPQGSYTGIFRASGAVGAPVYSPYNCNDILDDEIPVQDADDL